MPTSDQGMSYYMLGSIFGEILLSVFSSAESWSMDNNRQFGIVIMGSSVLLLTNPWIYKSPYSKVRPELNLDCVWTHKVTGLANNCTGLADFHGCPPTKLVYNTHITSHRFLWVQWAKKLDWYFYLLSNKSLQFSSNKTTVKSPKTQASEKNQIKQATYWVVNCSLSASCSHELTVLLP